MLEAGAERKSGSANFCPGPEAPSLQVCITLWIVWVCKVVAMVGAGHSSESAGQQSQSTSSSICSNVRLLCLAYARYTLEGVAPLGPLDSFARLTHWCSASAIVSLFAMPFLRNRCRNTDIARKSHVLVLCPFLSKALQITRGWSGRMRRSGSGFHVYVVFGIRRPGWPFGHQACRIVGTR
jgi:hypothetical protein